MSVGKQHQLPNSVVKAMDGLEKTQKFFRLFLLPGVTHCGGGDGPDTIDWLAAIQAWVEDGVAPTRSSRPGLIHFASMCFGLVPSAHTRRLQSIRERGTR